jgi:DNA-binding transcriptional LysR family regulator
MDQLRCLRVFSQVVLQGSFAGAARALDLPPAVVTRCVAELEAHLGARLLNRTTRRLALTEVGETYLVGARDVLALLDANDALAGVAVREPAGNLRVLCPPAFGVHQLAPVLPQFSARYPRIAVELCLPGPLDTADSGFDGIGAGIAGDTDYGTPSKRIITKHAPRSRRKARHAAHHPRAKSMVGDRQQVDQL